MLKRLNVKQIAPRNVFSSQENPEHPCQDFSLRPEKSGSGLINFENLCIFVIYFHQISKKALKSFPPSDNKSKTGTLSIKVLVLTCR